MISPMRVNIHNVKDMTEIDGMGQNGDPLEKRDNVVICLAIETKRLHWTD